MCIMANVTRIVYLQRMSMLLELRENVTAKSFREFVQSFKDITVL